MRECSYKSKNVAKFSQILVFIPTENTILVYKGVIEISKNQDSSDLSLSKFCNLVKNAKKFPKIILIIIPS